MPGKIGTSVVALVFCLKKYFPLYLSSEVSTEENEMEIKSSVVINPIRMKVMKDSSCLSVYQHLTQCLAHGSPQ